MLVSRLNPFEILLLNELRQDMISSKESKSCRVIGYVEDFNCSTKICVISYKDYFLTIDTKLVDSSILNVGHLCQFFGDLHQVEVSDCCSLMNSSFTCIILRMDHYY